MSTCECGVVGGFVVYLRYSLQCTESCPPEGTEPPLVAPPLVAPAVVVACLADLVDPVNFDNSIFNVKADL